MEEDDRTAQFYYTMQLNCDGTASVSQREATAAPSKRILDYGTRADLEVELYYNTDPGYSDENDPRYVVLELAFGDAGEYPEAYHGHVIVRLEWDQLARLHNFAAFLLNLRRP